MTRSPAPRAGSSRRWRIRRNAAAVVGIIADRSRHRSRPRRNISSVGSVSDNRRGIELQLIVSDVVISDGSGIIAPETSR
jgi:hypothetical protein